MDIVAICFYAVVCGLLGLTGPLFGGAFLRLITGFLVGAGSAALLPGLRPLIEELMVLYAPGLLGSG